MRRVADAAFPEVAMDAQCDVTVLLWAGLGMLPLWDVRSFPLEPKGI